MNRRALLQTGMGGMAMLFAGGLSEQQMPRQWLPDHIESTDPLWGMLQGAVVGIDEARGLMTATFNDIIQRMDGRPLSIGGFLMPLDARQRFTHFVLTRRNSSCPFCPPNEPTEAIEVMAEQAMEYAPNEFVVSGQFHVVGESSEGLFYRLSNARVRPA